MPMALDSPPSIPSTSVAAINKTTSTTIIKNKPKVAISNKRQRLQATMASSSSSLRSLSRKLRNPISRPYSHSAAAQPPLREVPGDCGPPLFGAWRDRQDYFYGQGREEFFRSRIKRHGSTVFRTNMPPGPFISPDPKVIALLDAKSFKVLFDGDKVEKKDLFTGTYVPSAALTGGYRTLSFLDPSEPNHKTLKQLIFYLLSHRKEHVIPEFLSSYGRLFEALEDGLKAKDKVDFGPVHDQAAFDFLARSFFDASPARSKLGSDGPKLIGKWVLFHLHPLLSLGLPRIIEDLFLHSFRLPAFLIKRDYQRLYEFFYENSTRVLDHGEKNLGLSREEACHNLVFATCFNSFGGMKILFPNILKLVGRGGPELHRRIAVEVRSAVGSNGGEVSVSLIEGSMPLVKSAVYECLRLEPPVSSQYGRARKGFVLESHGASFEVREGEVLYGFQPFATRDREVFDRPEEFVADRFVGEDGERLLEYVVWSNGPETAAPGLSDKQCAGKDFVVLASRLFLVELFRRYDSFGVEVGSSPLGVNVAVTSLRPAGAAEKS